MQTKIVPVTGECNKCGEVFSGEIQIGNDGRLDEFWAFRGKSIEEDILVKFSRHHVQSREGDEHIAYKVTDMGTLWVSGGFSALLFNEPEISLMRMFPETRLRSRQERK
ncbi:MAG: hypothetical protein ABIO02_00185 [Patescibacteria group bacterium]